MKVLDSAIPLNFVPRILAGLLDVVEGETDDAGRLHPKQKENLHVNRTNARNAQYTL